MKNLQFDSNLAYLFSLNTNQSVAVLSLCAGIVGTTLGGIIGTLFSSKNESFFGKLMAFSSGIMLGIVVFELLPDSIKYTKIDLQHFGWVGILTTLTAFLFGIIAMYLVNKTLEKIENKKNGTKGDHHKIVMMLQTKGKHIYSTKQQKEFSKVGISMFLVIFLHNVPEGMAIGSSSAVSLQAGVLMACIIAMHNLPEGMSISAPLASGGIKWWKSILMALIAGSATVVGAMIGILVGGISQIATGLCLGLSAGAMLFVIFDEMLAQVFKFGNGKFFLASFVFGFSTAMVLVFMPWLNL